MTTGRKYLNRSLPEEAEPTEWHQLRASHLENELKTHRFMDCENYKSCLTHACDRYWGGFTCHWCPLAETYMEEIRKNELVTARIKAREELNNL